MRRTLKIIDEAYSKTPDCCLAFSGGTDSCVLLDILYKHTPHRPPVFYCDDQMSYPDTEAFVRSKCEEYGAPLTVARGKRTPLQQWQTSGYAMLGKLAARQWQQKNKDTGMGFRLDVSSCCRNMKILPNRRAIKEAGMKLQFTGQRGNSDDALRGMRSYLDGAIKYVQTDKIWVANPLDGWTDTMVARYVRQNKLRLHPARERGACTIGCLFCGGGAQFTNSGFRILRHALPDEWRKFMIDWRVGEIVLALKYDKPRPVIQRALAEYGGIEKLAAEKPFIFDFTREEPLPGYEK